MRLYKLIWKPTLICAEIRIGLSNWQHERCQDKLSSEFMKALEEWLDKNC